MAKRTLDLVLALVGLLLISWLLAAVALAVKIQDGGPVIYGGTRVGRGGKAFRMLKFRTLVVDADRLGGPSTAANDPRLTRLGRLLRKAKLDELPQLVNVLSGEMSLVGPRPQVPEWVARYTEEERAILSVRPGITDWASLWNSDEGALLAKYPDPDWAYEELISPTKLRLQLMYVRDHSFWIDCQILALTALRLMGLQLIPSRVKRIAGRASA